MTDTVTAIVTRPQGFDHEGFHYEAEAVITLAENQFEDWRALGWVDRATPEQIEAAKAAAERAAAEQAKLEKVAAAKKPKADPA